MSVWNQLDCGIAHGICARSLAPYIPAPPAAADARPAPWFLEVRSVPPRRSQVSVIVAHYWWAAVCSEGLLHCSPVFREQATLTEQLEQEERHRRALQTLLGCCLLSSPAILLRTRNAARAWSCVQTLRSKPGRRGVSCSSNSPRTELLSIHSTGIFQFLRPTKCQQLFQSTGYDKPSCLPKSMHWLQC